MISLKIISIRKEYLKLCNCVQINHYFTPCEFFTPVRWWSFTGVRVTASLHRPPGVFLVFWPISTMLQSGWSWFFLFPFQAFGDHSKYTNYNWYHPHVPQFFQFSGMVQDLFIFSFSFIFTLWSTETENSTKWQILFFFSNTRSDLLTKIRWSICISK